MRRLVLAQLSAVAIITACVPRSSNLSSEGIKPETTSVNVAKFLQETAYREEAYAKAASSRQKNAVDKLYNEIARQIWNKPSDFVEIVEKNFITYTDSPVSIRLIGAGSLLYQGKVTQHQIASQLAKLMLGKKNRQMVKLYKLPKQEPVATSFFLRGLAREIFEFAAASGKAEAMTGAARLLGNTTRQMILADASDRRGAHSVNFFESMYINYSMIAELYPSAPSIEWAKFVFNGYDTGRREVVSLRSITVMDGPAGLAVSIQKMAQELCAKKNQSGSTSCVAAIIQNWVVLCEGNMKLMSAAEYDATMNNQ